MANTPTFYSQTPSTGVAGTLSGVGNAGDAGGAFPWRVAGGLGMLTGGILDFFLSQDYEMSFRPGGSYNEATDPMRLALGEFMKRTDLSSDYNKMLRSEFRRLATEAAPTIDTLVGANRASGVSGTGAYTLARKQSQADQVRGLDYATRAFQRQMLQEGDIASRYLGTYQQGLIAQEELAQRAYDMNQSNFGDQLLAGGLGLLGKFLA